MFEAYYLAKDFIYRSVPAHPVKGTCQTHLGRTTRRYTQGPPPMASILISFKSFTVSNEYTGKTFHCCLRSSDKSMTRSFSVQIFFLFHVKDNCFAEEQ